MLTVCAEDSDDLALDEVVDLYDSVGWTTYTRDTDSLRRALTGSHRIVTARDDGRLVGLARSISDGATIVYLQDALVAPGHQRSGIGRLLVTELLRPYATVRQQVLLTDTEGRQRAFYEALGFTEAHEVAPPLRAFIRFREAPPA